MNKFKVGDYTKIVIKNNLYAVGIITKISNDNIYWNNKAKPFNINGKLMVADGRLFELEKISEQEYLSLSKAHNLYQQMESIYFVLKDLDLTLLECEKEINTLYNKIYKKE